MIGPGITIRTDPENPPPQVRLQASLLQGTINIDSDTRFEILSSNDIGLPQTVSWTNSGEINVNAGQLVVGTLDPAHLGTIRVGEQGSIAFNGDYLNAGKTINQDLSTGVWTFDGAITGGSLVTSDGVVPIFGDLVLNGVQFTGGAEVDGFVQMLNGEFILNDILTLYNRSELYVEQPISGNGTIRFDEEGFGRLNFTMPELTLGEGIDVQVAGVDHRIFVRDFTSRGRITLEPNSFLEIQGNQFQSESEITIEEGAILDVKTSEFANVGRITLNDGLFLSRPQFGSGASIENTVTGVIEGDGVLRTSHENIVNEGTIGPGELLIQTDVIHQPGATLRFEIGGQTPDLYDSFLITGGLELAGGGLELTLVDDFVPTVDDEFSILYTNSITGQFVEENVMLGDMLFEIIYTSDTVSLRASTNALAVPEPSSTTLMWLGPCLLLVVRKRRRSL